MSKEFSNENWSLCIAPMLGITNEHHRFFMSLLSKRIRLYTEMIHVNAFINNTKLNNNLLNNMIIQNPVALQLGGSDSSMLYRAARMAENIGFNEINFNCGCPSEKVRKGLFGAILMNHKSIVADCLKSMMDAVNNIPITIKHRIGIGYHSSYEYLCDFVGNIYNIGCRIFIIHARNAILENMSPKENRKIPKLNYDFIFKLKKDFPDCTIIINGGLNNINEIISKLTLLDGVMIGRAVIKNPGIILNLSKIIWPNDHLLQDNEIILSIIEYINEKCYKNNSLKYISKSFIHLMNGRPGAKEWRRMISNISTYDDVSNLKKWIN